MRDGGNPKQHTAEVFITKYLKYKITTKMLGQPSLRLASAKYVNLNTSSEIQNTLYVNDTVWTHHSH